MPMMGGGGGSDDMYTMVDAAGDNERYQSKVNELLQHKQHAERTLQQAAENNRRAEENKKLAQGMLAEAQQQVLVAQRMKEEADKTAKAAVEHERAVNARAAELQSEYEARHKNLHGDLHKAFAGREADVTARENKLLADLQEYEAKKAALDKEKSDHDALKRREAAAMTQAGQDLRNKNEKLDSQLREAANMKAKLQEKLDKLKEIAVS